ncbi:MAG: hypothetical protein R3202_13895, partial [Candidatus Competibacterales bacterium]|nr:hypothetical protein [Candidatus Competibacterales bacterium]
MRRVTAGRTAVGGLLLGLLAACTAVEQAPLQRLELGLRLPDAAVLPDTALLDLRLQDLSRIGAPDDL